MDLTGNAKDNAMDLTGDDKDKASDDKDKVKDDAADEGEPTDDDDEGGEPGQVAVAVKEVGHSNCFECSGDCGVIDSDSGTNNDGQSVQFGCGCVFHINCLHINCGFNAAPKCPYCKMPISRLDQDNVKWGRNIIAAFNTEIPGAIVQKKKYDMPDLELELEDIKEVYTEAALVEFRGQLEKNYQLIHKSKTEYYVFPENKNYLIQRLGSYEYHTKYNPDKITTKLKNLYKVDKLALIWHEETEKLGIVKNRGAVLVPPAAIRAATAAQVGQHITKPSNKRHRINRGG